MITLIWDDGAVAYSVDYSAHTFIGVVNFSTLVWADWRGQNGRTEIILRRIDICTTRQ